MPSLSFIEKVQKYIIEHLDKRKINADWQTLPNELEVQAEEITNALKKHKEILPETFSLLVNENKSVRKAFSNECCALLNQAFQIIKHPEYYDQYMAVRNMFIENARYLTDDEIYRIRITQAINLCRNEFLFTEEDSDMMMKKALELGYFPFALGWQILISHMNQGIQDFLNNNSCIYYNSKKIDKVDLSRDKKNYFLFRHRFWRYFNGTRRYVVVDTSYKGASAEEINRKEGTNFSGSFVCQIRYKIAGEHYLSPRVQHETWLHDPVEVPMYCGEYTQVIEIINSILEYKSKRHTPRKKGTFSLDPRNVKELNQHINMKCNSWGAAPSEIYEELLSYAKKLNINILLCDGKLEYRENIESA